MRAVRAANLERPTRLSAIVLLQRLARIGLIPLTGLTTVIVLGFWLALHNGPAKNSSTPRSMPDISTAFTRSQEMVKALPSVAVGPLSDELDKVNRDLDRTTDFLLAAVP